MENISIKIEGEYKSSNQPPTVVTKEVIDVHKEHPAKFINPTPIIIEP